MTGEAVRLHLRNGDLTLALAAARAELQHTVEPRSQGILYALLARTLTRLGQPRQAMEAAERAAELTDAWEASLSLAEALVGMGQPVAARVILTESLKAARESTDAARPPPELVSMEVQIGAALAGACRAAGDPRTGISVAERAMAWAERYFGPKTPEAAEVLYATGVCLAGAAEYERAREVLTRCLQLRRAHTPESGDVAATLDALGSVLRHLGRPFKAVAHHREALGLWRALIGKHGSMIGACRHSLAQALHRTGDFVAAHAEMEAAARITETTLGPDHVDTWITRFELGRFEMDIGMHPEGLARMEEARRVVSERLGRTHPVVVAMDRWL